MKTIFVFMQFSRYYWPRYARILKKMVLHLPSIIALLIEQPVYSIYMIYHDILLYFPKVAILR